MMMSLEVSFIWERKLQPSVQNSVIVSTSYRRVFGNCLENKKWPDMSVFMFYRIYFIISYKLFPFCYFNVAEFHQWKYKWTRQVGTEQILVRVKSVWVADGQIIIALNLWKNLAERVKIYIIWSFAFLKKLAWARQQFFHRQKISLVKTGFPSGKIGASGRLIFLENSRRNLVHQKTWHKQFFWNQQTFGSLHGLSRGRRRERLVVWRFESVNVTVAALGKKFASFVEGWFGCIQDSWFLREA